MAIGGLIADLGILALIVLAVVGVIWWNKKQAAMKPPTKPDTGG